MPALITGIVTDETGRPVPGARIAFTSGPVPVPDVALITDRSGTFTVSAPTPGTYEITVVADGFLPQAITVQAAMNATSHPAISLKRA